jgi:hypothetical protein
MPIAVVFRCEICGRRPGPETQLALERQLLDLRHGEYVDAEPERWLSWHGRGIYGPTRYACGGAPRRAEGVVARAVRHTRMAPVGQGPAPVGGQARDRPRPQAAANRPLRHPALSRYCLGGSGKPVGMSASW